MNNQQHLLTMTMRVYCGVIMLSMAATTALIGVALTGIAFSTDNWKHISVNRLALQDILLQKNDEDLRLSLETDYRYFDRVRGIFRVCFPHSLKSKPNLPHLYLNPIEEWCTNVNYHFESLSRGWGLPPRITSHAETWFTLSRSSILLYCLYFMFTGIAFVFGLVGCWRTSGDYLSATASLLLLGAISGSSSIALMHAADFYERERVKDERLEFYLTWPKYLREATTFSLGWSYILAWVGIVITLLSSLFFIGSAIVVSKECKALLKDDDKIPGVTDNEKALHYYTPGYPIQSYENLSEMQYSRYNNVLRELEDGKI